MFARSKGHRYQTEVSLFRRIGLGFDGIASRSWTRWTTTRFENATNLASFHICACVHMDTHYERRAQHEVARPRGTETFFSCDKGCRTDTRTSRPDRLTGSNKVRY